MWYSCQIVDGINTRGSCRTVRIRSTHKQTDRVKSAYPTLFHLLQLCCTGLKIKVPNQKVTCYKITCLAHLWVNLMHHTYNVASSNTLKPRQNGHHFADDPFKRIFVNKPVKISIKVTLQCVPKGQINNIPALVQKMAWPLPNDKPWPKPMVVILLAHIFM